MNYWVIIDRRKIGPLSLEEARRLPLTPDTYVWHRGLSVWTSAASVAELADLFVATPSTSASEIAEVKVELLETETEQQAETIITDAESEASASDVVKLENDDQTAVNDQLRETMRRPLPPPPPAAPYFQPQQDKCEPKPPTYLGWSIAALLLCCLVTGVIAVIYASRVTTCYDSCDYEGARKASENAELWLIISFTLGIVSLPFQIVLAML